MDFDCEMCGRALTGHRYSYFHIEHANVPAKYAFTRATKDTTNHYLCEECASNRAGLIDKLFTLPPAVCERIHWKMMAELEKYEREMKNGANSL